MKPLLQLQNVSKTFASGPLFEGISLGVFAQERLAIVGANGSGKSTLLKIMAGKESCDQGEVTRTRGLRIHHVEQTFAPLAGETILETIERLVQEQHSGPVDQQELMRVLSVFGFDNPYVQADKLSGGWQRRINIAAGWASRSDLVLLDEPTNHLDLESILWLEDQMQKAPFAWVVISHDRYFLQSVAQRCIELSAVFARGYFEVDGGYLDLMQQKHEFIQNQQSQALHLANKLRREEEWLKQGAKARTTKSKSRIDAALQLRQQVASLKSRLRSQQSDISFQGTDSQSKSLISVKEVAIEIKTPQGSKHLFDGFNYNFGKGAKVGVLGGNGSGKSTLLRMLADELPPTSGTIIKRPEVKIVYFRQNRSDLNPDEKLRDALCLSDSDGVVFRGQSVHINAWARRFQFNPEQLDLKVSRLSGGEQARCLIARLMQQHADVLMLDEPSNDLDIPTLELLEENLADFPGALILVSHDRYLMESLCRDFIAIAEGKISSGFSSIEQWQQHLKKLPSAPQDSTSEDRESAPSGQASLSGSKTIKLSYMEQREYDRMESEIEEIELQLQQLQDEVQRPELSTQAARLAELSRKIEQQQTLLEQKYSRWVELEQKQKPPN